MPNTEQIREHMEVLGADGKHVGVVDHLEGADQIKLTRKDPKAGGQHHLIPVNWVDRIDAKVHLKKNSSDVLANWKPN
jgi:hypothetical protein